MTVHPKRSEDVRVLLVKASDGLLSHAEQTTLDGMMRDDPSLAQELDELRDAKDALAPYGVRDPNPVDWERMEKNLVAQGARGLGWLLVGFGSLFLVGAAVSVLIMRPELPLLVRLAGGAIATGLALLTGYVGYGAAQERQRDPYKNVFR